MTKLISIIVPIYNVERYLTKCIDSIISQTYKNLQIILVDDGSVDRSGEICDACQEKDGRIVVIHQENKGLVSARKAGLHIAKGEYVGFVDGDDYIEEDMYEKLFYAIRNADADMVHAGYFRNDETQVRGTGDHAVIDFHDADRTSVIIELIFDLKKGQIMSPCLCFKLFKADLIKRSYETVPDAQSYGEDLISLCSTLYLCKKVVILEEAYYHYTIRNDSIMNLVNRQMLLRQNSLRNCLEELALKSGQYDELWEAIDTYWLTGILDDLKKIYPEAVRVFHFPLVEALRNKRVILYGAGAVGRDYYSQIRLYMSINLVAWIDQNAQNMESEYCEIETVNHILTREFDYIVIAVLSERQAAHIKEELAAMGIGENRLIWSRPVLSSVMKNTR